MTPKTWRKSTRSQGSGNNCVEAGTCPCHGIAIRDSKLPTTGDFPTLSVALIDWAGLLTAIKAETLNPSTS